MTDHYFCMVCLHEFEHCSCGQDQTESEEIMTETTKENNAENITMIDAALQEVERQNQGIGPFDDSDRRAMAHVLNAALSKAKVWKGNELYQGAIRVGGIWQNELYRFWHYEINRIARTTRYYPDCSEAKAALEVELDWRWSEYFGVAQ